MAGTTSAFFGCSSNPCCSRWVSRRCGLQRSRFTDPTCRSSPSPSPAIRACFYGETCLAAASGQWRRTFRCSIIATSGRSTSISRGSPRSGGRDDVLRVPGAVLHFHRLARAPRRCAQVAAAGACLLGLVSRLAIFLGCAVGSLRDGRETLASQRPICCSRFRAPRSSSTHCHMPRSSSFCCCQWSMASNFFGRAISGRRSSRTTTLATWR